MGTMKQNMKQEKEFKEFMAGLMYADQGSFFDNVETRKYFSGESDDFAGLATYEGDVFHFYLGMQDEKTICVMEISLDEMSDLKKRLQYFFGRVYGATNTMVESEFQTKMKNYINFYVEKVKDEMLANGILAIDEKDRKRLKDSTAMWKGKDGRLIIADF